MSRVLDSFEIKKVDLRLSSLFKLQHCSQSMNALVLALGKHVDQQKQLLEEYREHFWPQLVRCEITQCHGHTCFDVLDPQRPHDSLDMPLSLTYSPKRELILKYMDRNYWVCNAKITQIKIDSPSAQSPDFDVRLSTKFRECEDMYYLTVRSDYAEMGFVERRPLIYRFPNDYDPKIKEKFSRFLEDTGYTCT